MGLPDLLLPDAFGKLEPATIEVEQQFPHRLLDYFAPGSIQSSRIAQVGSRDHIIWLLWGTNAVFTSSSAWVVGVGTTDFTESPSEPDGGINQVFIR